MLSAIYKYTLPCGRTGRWSEEGQSALLQLRVLPLGFFQDGNVGVGVFPQREKILVGGAGLGGVTCSP
jgi:hypothetical protein